MRERGRRIEIEKEWDRDRERVGELERKSGRVR